ARVRGGGAGDAPLFPTAVADQAAAVTFDRHGGFRERARPDVCVRLPRRRVPQMDDAIAVAGQVFSVRTEGERANLGWRDLELVNCLLPVEIPHVKHSGRVGTG